MEHLCHTNPLYDKVQARTAADPELQQNVSNWARITARTENSENAVDISSAAQSLAVHGDEVEQGTERTMPPLRGFAQYTDKWLEAKTYPHLFPLGQQGTYEDVCQKLGKVGNTTRNVISKAQYAKYRLCTRDNHFGKDLLWAHDWMRLKIVLRRQPHS